MSASGNNNCCYSTFHCPGVSLDAAAVCDRRRCRCGSDNQALCRQPLGSICVLQYLTFSISAARLTERLHFPCTLCRCVLAEIRMIRHLQGYQLGEKFHCTECWLFCHLWLQNDHTLLLLLSLSFFSLGSHFVAAKENFFMCFSQL